MAGNANPGRFRQGGHGILWRLALSAVLALLLAPIVAFVALIHDLPSLSAMGGAASFQTSQVFDRHGELLWEFNDPMGGKRVVIPLRDMPAHLIAAVLAAEDADFYQHPGFDPLAAARAAAQVIGGEGRSGGSTITQQLVRNVVMSPEEARQVTLRRKLREIILAYRVDQHFSKEQILETYLNEVYFGNQSYGVEAASQGYFGRPAGELTLGEAALLAGLIQAPSAYDPTRKDVPRGPDGLSEATKERQRYVLEQMAKHGFISQEQAERALQERIRFRKRAIELKAPHWVMYVRALVERKYGDRALYREGLRITTTLDFGYHERMQEELREARPRLEKHGANNAALIAVDPRTGEILAFNGSLDYEDEAIDGQVNVLLSERQPGSAIKPIVYAGSFLKGWSPGTFVQDEPKCWEDRPGHQWCPQNFDGRFHGQMTVRTALGNSINVPAVKALELVGVERAASLGTAMGISTWGSRSGKHLGLSLTLGGAEVRPIDLAQVYATLANNGAKVPLTAIRRVETADGRVLEELRAPRPEQVLDPRAAYMITDILVDPKAKLYTYGRNTSLVLDRPAASKTGTTDNFRDTWTAGYTPNLVMVVWVGNTDGKPMRQALSSMTAGRIWPEAMRASFDYLGLPSEEYPRPGGLVVGQVCGDTVMRPGEPPCRAELFLEGQAPKPPPAPPAPKPRVSPKPAPAREMTPSSAPDSTPPPTKPPPAKPSPEATPEEKPEKPTAEPKPSPEPTPEPKPTPGLKPTPAPEPTSGPQPTRGGEDKPRSKPSPGVG